MTAAARPVLEAEDVVAGYGDAEILHGVSLRVDAGEVVSIIGPNGAGKSTMIKAVFGLIPARRGRILLDGADVTNRGPEYVAKRGMSYVPQVDNVFPSLSVHENLEMGAYILRGGMRERLSYVYDTFPDLAPRRRERADRLSGGQRQMLALGRALMMEPEVLLLDEPSAGLSPKMIGLVFEKIAAINEAGTAILLVEQNAHEALRRSHRAYVLAMGENRLEGEARSLLDSEDVARLYVGE